MNHKIKTRIQIYRKPDPRFISIFSFQKPARWQLGINQFDLLIRPFYKILKNGIFTCLPTQLIHTAKANFQFPRYFACST